MSRFAFGETKIKDMYKLCKLFSSMTGNQSSTLSRRIPMDRGAWWATVQGSQRIKHGWVTKHSTGMYNNNNNYNNRSTHREYFFYLFIFGCPGSSLQCAGSCCRAQALGAGSSYGSLQAVEHSHSYRGTWAWLPYCMWDLHGLGIKPMYSALAGWLLTTRPPRMFWECFLNARPFIYFNLFNLRW